MNELFSECDDYTVNKNRNHIKFPKRVCQRVKQNFSLSGIYLLKLQIWEPWLLIPERGSARIQFAVESSHWLSSGVRW